MKKLISSLFVFALLLLGWNNTASAAEEFQTDTSIYYQVNADGKTQVTHYITLINKFTDYYATSYSLSLHNIEPAEIIAYQGKTKLSHNLIKRADKEYTIQVNFNDVVVGQGERRDFSIHYVDETVAQKTGEVWEISVPKLADPGSFGSYKVTLSVPTILGELAYVSPKPHSRNLASARNILTFEKGSLTQSAVVAAFGKFQVFSFKLDYHLENPLNKRSSIELAIPPDTAYQKVIIENMTPRPLTVNKDKDGNWLAFYVLDSRQKLDVRAEGAVQIYAEPREFPRPSDETLNNNKKASEVWQINDTQIVELANSLKTPQAIYDYVVKTLKYDYERAKPNVTRLGALQALNNPTNAICMEFTDLFIALARASGIPAREVNGYAYTQNPEIEPLSLVADVLHAWPEYWDEAKGLWIPIDPTWGNTTGGVDFFSKLDLRHFAFVYHGSDPYLPYPPGSYKLGPNPQKDIFVEFGDLPLERNPKAQLSVGQVSSPLFKDMQGYVEVRNVGFTSLPRAKVDVYFDNDFKGSTLVSDLPPFASTQIPFKVPFQILGYKLPSAVSIRMNDQTIAVPTYKDTLTILNISVLFLAIFLILLLALVRIKRIKVVYAVTTFKNNLIKRLNPRRSA